MRVFVGVLLFWQAADLSAATIAVANASFESVASNANTANCVASGRLKAGFFIDAVTNFGLTGGCVDPAPLPGWAITGHSAGVQYGGLTATDGNNIAYSNGGTISQTLGEVLRVGTYTLSVDIGNRNDSNNLNGYTIALFAGGTQLAAHTNFVAPPPGQFKTDTLVINVTAGDPSLGQPLKIQLSGPSPQVNFDNVRLDGPVARIPLGSGTLTVSGGLADAATPPAYVQNPNGYAFKLTDGITTVAGQERRNNDPAGGPNKDLQTIATFDGRQATVTGTISALTLSDTQGAAGGSQFFSIGLATRGALDAAATSHNSTLISTPAPGKDGFAAMVFGYFVDGSGGHLYVTGQDWDGQKNKVYLDLTMAGLASGQSISRPLTFTMAFSGSSMSLAINGQVLGSTTISHDLSNVVLVAAGWSGNPMNGAATMTYSSVSAGTPNAAGPPALTYLVSGDNQIGVAGAKLTAPLVVGVVDAFRNPVPGVTVAFTGVNASTNPTSAQTDANGLASTQVTLGGTAGPAKVTASVAGVSATANLTVQAARPAILPGGVISAGAFGGQPGVAPGTWIEIYGANLADRTRDWGGADFNGDNAPTQLDQVKVAVNGKPAAIWHIGQGQVNAQVPDDIGTGPVQVVVSNNGQQSNAVIVQASAVLPGLLSPPVFNTGGKQYVVALAADGRTFVGVPDGFLGGRPARPGEAITLYGIGFGPVVPAIKSGTVTSVLNRLQNPLTVLFDQTPVDLNAANTYYGLAPGVVGLYQFNLAVPNVADGDHKLTVTVGGVTPTQDLWIATKQ